MAKRGVPNFRPIKKEQRAIFTVAVFDEDTDEKIPLRSQQVGYVVTWCIVIAVWLVGAILVALSALL